MQDKALESYSIEEITELLQKRFLDALTKHCIPQRRTAETGLRCYNHMLKRQCRILWHFMSNAALRHS